MARNEVNNPNNQAANNAFGLQIVVPVSIAVILCAVAGVFAYPYMLTDPVHANFVKFAKNQYAKADNELAKMADAHGDSQIVMTNVKLDSGLQMQTVEKADFDEFLKVLGRANDFTDKEKAELEAVRFGANAKATQSLHCDEKMLDCKLSSVQLLSKHYSEKGKEKIDLYVGTIKMGFSIPDLAKAGENSDDSGILKQVFNFVTGSKQKSGPGNAVSMEAIGNLFVQFTELTQKQKFFELVVEKLDPFGFDTTDRFIDDEDKEFERGSRKEADHEGTPKSKA